MSEMGWKGGGKGIIAREEVWDILTETYRVFLIVKVDALKKTRKDGPNYTIQ